MIPQKVKDHIEEYISQEVYVQIAIIKGKEKVSTETAIDKYFNTNHFRDFSEGKPYFHFIDGLRDKCLGKLKNSPMKDKETEDETIKLLQKKALFVSGFHPIKFREGHPVKRSRQAIESNYVISIRHHRIDSIVFLNS